MISLDKEQTCLLQLIKVSLFDLKPEFPENVDWDKVFELAKAQCIVPLVASHVPEVYRNEWLIISYQSKARFMQILYEQNSITRLFKNFDIPFVVFKGTAAAIYYPTPSLRTYGDIDLYVSKEYFESAAKLLESNGYQFVEENYRHNAYLKSGIEVELHYRISSYSYNNIDNIFLNGMNNAVENEIINSSFPCMPTYENGLVLLGHIMQHLKGSGVGLRQIIDWMMFVYNDLDDVSWNNHFRVLAVEAGLEKLATSVTYMCKKWLGLSDEVTWCNSVNEEVADQLLLRVLDDGNLGHDRAPNERIKKTLKKEGTFKYLQRAGMINWPLAQKFAFFRPFAWLYQLFKYAGKGITGLFTGKKVFMKNNSKMSLEELLERLE